MTRQHESQHPKPRHKALFKHTAPYIPMLKWNSWIFPWAVERDADENYCEFSRAMGQVPTGCLCCIQRGASSNHRLQSTWTCFGGGGSDLGPLSILQDMWMKPDAAETNILYSLFADIRDMNITGRRLAWENLENADEITGEYIIKSCKVVTLKPEDEVLVILPDDSNTLLTTWQCLYTVVWHISNVDYIINVCSHHKVYNSTCLNYIPQGQSV